MTQNNSLQNYLSNLAKNHLTFKVTKFIPWIISYNSTGNLYMTNITLTINGTNFKLNIKGQEDVFFATAVDKTVYSLVQFIFL